MVGSNRGLCMAQFHKEQCHLQGRRKDHRRARCSP